MDDKQWPYGDHNPMWYTLDPDLEQLDCLSPRSIAEREHSTPARHARHAPCQDGAKRRITRGGRRRVAVGGQHSVNRYHHETPVFVSGQVAITATRLETPVNREAFAHSPTWLAAPCFNMTHPELRGSFL
ncbi:hypothetical protein ElyMa_001233700 [Elysia marginata]|uniref:Uncharacterized protein n=1 Tax=Elysia marginata TaxID=1093978 RepID=A0AAV4IA25_9GAST|nr:hypothetical protein ElyMa_001233700 [Elysia marginata]